MLDGLFNMRSESHHLRFDTCGLEYIDSLATILLLQVFIEVRTRTETSDENDTLDDVSSVFFKLLASSSYADRKLFFLDFANLFINKLCDLAKRLSKGFLNVGASHALSATTALVIGQRTLT